MSFFYNRLSMEGVNSNDKLAPSLQVFSNILSLNYLHKEIREKGIIFYNIL
jgi:Zn-dependent M16 (insulinase) family peptidase